MFKRLLTNNLNHNGKIFNILQTIYHEVKYLYQRLYFIVVWPKVKIFRINNDELNAINNKGYRSQFGQDYILDTYFLNGVNNGFFVDVGCNHPEEISNSYYFELKKGWQGLAFDPLQKYRGDWDVRRKNTCFYGVALGNEEKNIEFVEIEAVAGWEHTLSALKNNVRKEDLQYPHKTIIVKMKRLAGYLEHLEIKQVDLLLIDVEGAEYDVLLGLNLLVNRPKVIVLENTNGWKGDDEIRKFLIKNNYLFSGRVWTVDDVFVDKIQ